MKTPRFFSTILTGCLVLTAGDGALAQSPSPWFQQLRVNGFVSTSFTYNFNRPESRLNQLRVFDQEDGAFLLDVCELAAQINPAGKGEAGFRVDVTAGSSIPRATASAGLFRDEEKRAADLDIHQALVSYVVPWGKGLRLDLGKHVSHLGYEIIEGTDGANDCATRSFLFGYAIPYTHTGLRCGYAFSRRLSGAFYLVNGWDVSRDNNRAKTLGAQVVWTPSSRTALTANYLGGAEQDSSTSNLRHTFDLVGIFKAGDRLDFGLNADYGMERDVLVSSGRKDVVWRGAAVYLRAGLHPRFALCGRAEVLQDPDGARTGTEQRLEEVTFTPELRLASGLLLRADLRYDFSDQPVFQRKSGPDGRKGQPTITMNANFTF